MSDELEADGEKFAPDAAAALGLYDLELVRQHVGWMKIYVHLMTEDTWRDMRDRIQSQLNDVSKVINP